MKTSIKTLRLAIVFAGGAIIGTSALAGPLYTGEPADAADAQRTITIKPDARWVNVVQGETVKFVDANSGKSFVWRFDTPSWTAFDLASVAPGGMLSGHHVEAYVALAPGNADE